LRNDTKIATAVVSDITVKILAVGCVMRNAPQVNILMKLGGFVAKRRRDTDTLS
tara:strand:- start:83 stop:244 length:162 start_codon:yes stop_codon:yes gene_type:complete